MHVPCSHVPAGGAGAPSGVQPAAGPAGQRLGTQLRGVVVPSLTDPAHRYLPIPGPAAGDRPAESGRATRRPDASAAPVAVSGSSSAAGRRSAARRTASGCWAPFRRTRRRAVGAVIPRGVRSRPDRGPRSLQPPRPAASQRSLRHTVAASYTARSQDLPCSSALRLEMHVRGGVGVVRGKVY